MASKYEKFRAAPPGWTMTQSKGKWNWDSPPKYVTPYDAVEYVTSKIEQPEIEMTYVKMMLAGVSVQEIVNSIAMVGFAQGYYTPDVAEIIKNPLSIYFMGLAAEKGIPVRVFAGTDDGSPEVDEGMDDDTLLNMMRKRNPQVYAMYMDREIEAGKQARRQIGTFMQPGLEPAPMVEEEPMAPEEMVAGPMDENIEEELNEQAKEVIEGITGEEVGVEPAEEVQGELPLDEGMMEEEE